MGDLENRALNWILNGRVGMSSKAIWAHMVGAETEWSHPRDPDDLSRCLKLLEDIPEWEERMPEMAQRSEYWRVLTDNWEVVKSSFMKDKKNGWKSSGTYDLMRKIYAPIERKNRNQPNFCFTLSYP